MRLAKAINTSKGLVEIPTVVNAKDESDMMACNHTTEQYFVCVQI